MQVARSFDQLLEHVLSQNAELTHTEKNKRNRLEKALRAARRRTASMSGMGERYDSALAWEKSILAKVGEYRPLTKLEVMVARHPYHQFHESDETRLLASLLQKLDAMPQMMPYNTIWTGVDVVVKRLGLTPEEGRALAGSKAWQKAKNGYEIDRAKLKLSATRPDVPATKQRLRQAALPGRNREEVGTYQG